MRDRVFTNYVGAYREAIEATRYADLPHLQPRPFANLSFGGAGTAYVLGRLGDRRRARAWIRAALADRRRAACDPADPSSPAPPRASLLFGALGIRWVAALLDPAETPGYVRALRGAPDRVEYATGLAGQLAGLRLLGASPARDRSAARLADQLGERLRATTAWPAGDGFAHGWLGPVHSLLAWYARDVPAWLAAIVAERARAWEPTPRVLPVSWCNGLAGATMMWARAHASTGEPAYLDLARACARGMLAHTGDDTTLCCGDGGAAFALLALARVDRGEGWRERAREIAAAAIARAALTWPNGLYRGHPGLICLALDCVAGDPVGYPSVEGA